MPILSGAAKSIASCSYRRQFRKTAVLSLRHNITRSPTRKYHPISLNLAEDVEEYRLGGFHPVHIGDVFQAKYKVLHKLGAGGFSTTWLARDTVDKKYVALKILKAEETASYSELRMLQSLANIPGHHPGRRHIRMVLDSFFIEGPNGRHNCVITEVAGPSLNDLYNVPGMGYTAGARRLRANIARKVNSQIIEAIDFLHFNRVCHGDLTTSNLLLHLKSIDDWKENEIYQHFDVCLVDFGEAFQFEEPVKSEDIGIPFMYRAPETIFESKYDRFSEIWALASNGAMKGKLPDPWWKRWDKRTMCFGEDGRPLDNWPEGRVLAVQYPLEEMIGDIGSEDDESAIASGPASEMLERSWTKVDMYERKAMRDLLDGMLQWQPEERLSLEQIRKHRWITG
ncbi:hypothetical protein CERZMDRAFT_108335 [Cercospora zeae-maydis SCOH1-5]|uniref:EKC/KEOPS complex subunit BUD32 n=1 Tax=Cercospora zeae-maydis SCOH1-5 TaxID=717836 RepID=A0A6A6FWR8_9PEZI|nr:hypothetical protein CERZMDRAFT_108335 [Cercospora zeae-maydis SCOH1-5]